MSSAAQPAKFSASLCHRGHGAPQRPQQGLGTVRGPAGWGDRDFRQSLLGLAPPLRVVQARGLLGHTSQGGYAVAGGSAVSAGTHRQYPARRSGANEILGFASALSGVVAAGSSDGGGGWEMAADGVFVGQPAMERADDRRSVSVPMGNRSVFQRDQANPPIGRLPGPQCQCGALAGMDGALD